MSNQSNWLDWLATREAVPAVTQKGGRAAAVATLGTWDTETGIIHLPPGYTSGPNSGPVIMIRPKIRHVDVPRGWTIGVDKPPPPPVDPSTSNLVKLHNQFRAANGLAPLVVDARLMRAAQDYAEEMARRGVLSHFSADGSTPWDRMVRAGYNWSNASENIASGYTTDEDVMTGWINSPGHRADILGPYSNIGTGRSGNWWVCDFATSK